MHMSSSMSSRESVSMTMNVHENEFKSELGRERMISLNAESK